jgi:hypothetical protein
MSSYLPLFILKIFALFPIKKEGRNLAKTEGARINFDN